MVPERWRLVGSGIGTDNFDGNKDVRRSEVSFVSCFVRA